MGTAEPTQAIQDRVSRELPHLGRAEAEDLARTVARLSAVFQPHRIYVFGSQARGTPDPNSDIDLMVVVESAAEPPYRLSQAAYGVVGRHLVPLDILFMTRAEFDSRVPAVASLPATILREGRVLYAA